MEKTILQTPKAITEKNYFPVIKTILVTSFIAGSLDGAAAVILYGPVFGKASCLQIFQGIASAAFGKDAYQGGIPMGIYGVFIHYFIAFSFTVLFFFISPYIVLLQKKKLLSGVLYGIFVWSVMNLIVIPLSKMHTTIKPISAVKGNLILIICVGIPISFFINRYYQKYGRRVESKPGLL